jgi:hypothetical protein
MFLNRLHSQNHTYEYFPYNILKNTNIAQDIVPINTICYMTTNDPVRNVLSILDSSVKW